MSDSYSQVDVSLDTSQFHSGTRALRFVFSGPAFSDSGVFQYVPVQPNARYRLNTVVKSEDIVSASGPRIVVQDYYNNQVLERAVQSRSSNESIRLVPTFVLFRRTLFPCRIESGF